MKEDLKDVYQAADVVLMIIENEGSISDEIEYPSEFAPAYQKLMELGVIQTKNGEYVPATNFHRAHKMGTWNYEQRKNDPSKLEQFLSNKYTIGIIAGTFLTGIGYFLRPGKKA